MTEVWLSWPSFSNLEKNFIDVKCLLAPSEEYLKHCLHRHVYSLSILWFDLWCVLKSHQFIYTLCFIICRIKENIFTLLLQNLTAGRVEFSSPGDWSQFGAVFQCRYFALSQMPGFAHLANCPILWFGIRNFPLPQIGNVWAEKSCLPL